jgi:hypothetical protein
MVNGTPERPIGLLAGQEAKSVPISELVGGGWLTA